MSVESEETKETASIRRPTPLVTHTSAYQGLLDALVQAKSLPLTSQM